MRGGKLVFGASDLIQEAGYCPLVILEVDIVLGLEVLHAVLD